LSTRQAPVINGLIDQTNAFPFVGTWGCSAVAISPTVVLSASHCLPAGMAAGCGTWSPREISFAGVGGNITNPSTIKRTAVAMRLHPSLFDASACPIPEGEVCTKDVVSCEQTICDDQVTPDAGIFTAQTWRGDMIALLLDNPLPPQLIAKVLVSPVYADPSKGLIANGSLFGKKIIEDWVLSEKPNVTIVGYGLNVDFG
jgi:hypothetical protein